MGWRRGEEGRDGTRWAGGGGKKEGMGLGGLREGEKGGTGLGGLGEGSNLHQLYETNKAGTLNTKQLRTSEPYHSQTFQWCDENQVLNHVDLNIRFVHVHRLDLSSARIAWLL